MAGKVKRKQDFLVGIVPKGHVLLSMTGMVTMLLGALLLIFTLYVAPHLVFGLYYPVPDFIIEIRIWLDTQARVHDIFLLVAILGPPIIISVAMFFIATMATKRLDRYMVEQLHDHAGEELLTEERPLLPREAEHLAAKIIFIIICLLCALVFTEIFFLRGI